MSVNRDKYRWINRRPNARDASTVANIGGALGFLSLFLTVGGVISDTAGVYLSAIFGSMGLASLFIWWVNIKGMERTHGSLIWLGGLVALGTLTMFVVAFALFIMSIYY